MTVYELSRTILRLNHCPINKIRLARMVYFVHKELIRKKFMTKEDISYIRSPLGPIPEGFLSLAEEDSEIITKRDKNTALSYGTEEYALKNNDEADEETQLLEQYRELLAATEHVVKALNGFTTPELVRESHRDPSWLAHANGEIYHITTADLKNAFPFSTLPAIRIKIRFSKSKTNEIGILQANLLRGMISDIVKESTDLEYPNDAKTATKPKPKTKAKAKAKFKLLRRKP